MTFFEWLKSRRTSTSGATLTSSENSGSFSLTQGGGPFEPPSSTLSVKGVGYLGPNMDQDGVMSLSCTLLRASAPSLAFKEIFLRAPSNVTLTAMEQPSQLKLTLTFFDEAAAREMKYWIALQAQEPSSKLLINLDFDPPPSSKTLRITDSASGG